MEKVILVAMNRGEIKSFDEKILEFEALAEAANCKVMGIIVQNNGNTEPSTLIRKGKVLEVKEAAENLEVDTIIFFNNLKGSQIRNLESVIEKKIIDRTMLILDIFSQRAISNEGKLQVKLAQLKYRLPRLSGFGNSLSREGGGIGTRGPGEQKIELDRRKIRQDIDNIKIKLDGIEKVRANIRKKRVKNKVPIVALVGYTNVGKSTILNKMLEVSKSNSEEKQVFAKDMLFATLETRFREIETPNKSVFLAVDTVGLVSDLPINLVEAFKSTLEEITYADIILHVVDSSADEIDLQITTTNGILKDLNVEDKKTIYLFNKIDKIKDDNILIFDNIPSSEKMYISAKNPEDIEKVILTIQNSLNTYIETKLLIPFSKTNILDSLTKDHTMKAIDYNEEGSIITLDLNENEIDKYKDYILEE